MCCYVYNGKMKYIDFWLLNIYIFCRENYLGLCVDFIERREYEFIICFFVIKKKMLLVLVKWIIF